MTPQQAIEIIQAVIGRCSGPTYEDFARVSEAIQTLRAHLETEQRNDEPKKGK